MPSKGFSLFLTLLDPRGADLLPPRAITYTRTKAVSGNSDIFCIFLNACYRVFFLTGPPFRLTPPKNASTGPPLNFLSVGITFTLPDT